MRAIFRFALFLGFFAVATGVLLELGLRAWFAWRVGPDVLLFGTPWCCGAKEQLAFDRKGGQQRLVETSHTVHEPDRVIAGYRKYAPGQKRSDATVEGDPIEVVINSHGFRGRDFEVRKAPGTIRVVALGASSTFGYTDREHETYPVYLEELLNERIARAGCTAGERFEVINLGIPHLWSLQIRALFEHEALPLDPDVVTLYAGVNDAKPGGGFRVRPNEYELPEVYWEDVSWPVQVLFVDVVPRLRSRLLIFALLDNLVTLHARTFDPAIVDDYAAHKVREFVEHVAAIHEEAQRAGARLVPVTQQAHLRGAPPPPRGETYAEEVARVSDKAARGERLTMSELLMLTHARIMEGLRRWAAEEGVPLVDGIAALDARRDLMSSYVHLRPEANRILAEAMAEKIFPLVCGEGAASGPSAPYPPSDVVGAVRFDSGDLRREAPGSDNWAVTWAEDDVQLATWGDGGGFGGTNARGRVSLGVARIEGPWPDFRTVNVWGGWQALHPAEFEGKSYGILALGDAAYMWVSPGSDADNYREARLARSTDGGAHWERAPWAFTAADGIILPTFVQFGPAYAGARDEFVYVHAPRLEDATRLAIQRPGAIDLLRVHRSRLWERGAYEAFAGLDAEGGARWTHDLAQRAPVFTDPNGVGWTVSVTRDPRLGRYLLATEHLQSFAGNLGLFEAPEPWGPWRTVLYTGEWLGAGQTTPGVFFWNFSRRWSNGPDLGFRLIFTGTGGYDAFNAVGGRFVRREDASGTASSGGRPTAAGP